MNRSAMSPLKGRFPFRIGTTSYIVPHDILPNVRFLADIVDDVELVLFESDEISNLPTDAVVGELRALAQAKNLSYTVHLPMDIELGSADESVRERSVRKCLRVVSQMAALAPFAHVLHFQHAVGMNPIPSEDVPRWTAALERSIRDLLKAGLEPGALCVETLSYPFELVEHIVNEYDLSVCLDVGHLLLMGYPLEETIGRLLPRSAVLHVHGVAAGKDHCAISHIPAETWTMLLSALAGAPLRPRVMTVEVFNETDLRESLDRLKESL